MYTSTGTTILTAINAEWGFGSSRFKPEGQKPRLGVVYRVGGVGV